MILQTGQRTDIPAFYGPWFANRIQEGYVDVRNPYNPKRITRYRINPNVIDGIAFCTKNPHPFMKYLPILDGYRQYWHMTVTPYDTDIEPYVPPAEHVIEGFKQIGKTLNPASMVWRYDPIIINHTYTYDFHCESFHKMAKSLCGYTDTVIVSFIDIYDKVLANFPEGKRPPKDVQMKLISELVSISRSFHMTLKTCGEGHVFHSVGAYTEGCLTQDCYERAWNVSLQLPKRQPARPECLCYLHGDIGAYDSCAHFCRYCYANTNQDRVRSNRSLHDPKSSLLIGHIEDGDVVVESPMKSWIIPSQDSFNF